MQQQKKTFLPTTLIEWFTIITLVVGITASIYSVLVKPYRHIISLEKRFVLVEERVKSIDKNIEWIMRRLK